MTDEQQPMLAPEAPDERARRIARDGIDYSDKNLTLDASEDSWKWRAKLRSNPTTHLIWRTAVGVVGGLVTIGGLIAVPAPGPGWLIVFFGLSILASEFEFAQRWLHYGRRKLTAWNDWIMSQALWVRGLVALATLVLVWLIFWAYFAFMGVPGFFPDWAEEWLRKLPGVE